MKFFERKKFYGRTAVVVAISALAHTYGAFAQSPPLNGEALFKTHCAVCHTGALDTRAPSPETLRQKSPNAILEALMSGSMRVQGASLSGPERHVIAEYIADKPLGDDPTGAAKGRCERGAKFDVKAGSAWNGWGAGVANTRFQTAAAAKLSIEQVSRLELKWAFGFPDATSAWAQPSVVGGRVFVGSPNGTVYSLDAKSGCIHWFFSSEGGVRTAITVSQRTKGGAAVYFGDTGAKAYALDAETGKLLWKTKVEEHPLARITGAPLLYRDRLYVPMSSYEESQGARPDYACCTFRGSVSALDAETGKIAWRSFMIPKEPQPRGKSSTGVTLFGPAGVPIWSAPTIDEKRKLIYVGTGNSYTGEAAPSSDAIVALDLAKGNIVWMKQLHPNDVFVSGCRAKSDNPNCSDQSGPDFDFGNSPIIANLPNGKDAIVIGQKSGIGWALDPDNKGEILWQYRAGQGGALGGIEWGSAVDIKNAYFAVADTFSSTPGGLHAVDLLTGKRAWFAPPVPKCASGANRCNGAQAAAITVIPGVVFSGANDGFLRAYSTGDGSIVWEFDMNKDFPTLNGIAAKGASMMGPGVTVADGMLFVPSGYGAFGGRPGNVLLAFGIASAK